MKPVLNPTTNNISGDLIPQIEKAVRNSGYPVQLHVARMLSEKFHVQQEWAYKDSKDDSIRTIDLIAEKNLWMEKTKHQPKVRPMLNLIIECKQSKNPLVFFLSNTGTTDYEYPQISGLRKDTIDIKTDDDRSTWSLSINHLFELYRKDFVAKSPKFSATFSKLIPNKKKPTLSGEDIYLSTVLPLVDAANYFKECENPSKTALYFDFHMIFAIAVVNAPIIGIEKDGNNFNQVSTPWIRLLRWQTAKEEDWFKRGTTFSIDFIHVDFFEEFINNHLLPFADEYAKLVLKNNKVIINGKGFINGMGKNSWSNFEKRLKS